MVKIVPVRDDFVELLGLLAFGVLVDAVSAVLEIPATDIEPPPGFGARIRADYISDMAKMDGKFVILLDSGAVLSLDDLATLVAMDADTPSPEAMA